MPGWGVVEGALRPSFPFWDSSEKVFSWAALESAEMVHWTICSPFQPIICESKHGGGGEQREEGCNIIRDSHIPQVK